MLPPVPVEIDIPSLKRIDECLQKQPLLEEMVKKQGETIARLQVALADKEKELALEKRENEINVKMLAIKDKEIAGINRNFDQMKEVADRSLKLAEISKPKSNWELQGLAVLGAILFGIIVGK